tara:strand:- start:12 stop:425 length:414 start_codon:yes stop_codon:yes gene_type:complete
MEIWKPLKNWESSHEISTYGRIRNIQPGKYYHQIKSLHERKQYLIVHLWCKVRKRKIQKQVHQLVAETFLEHVPCGNKIVVDHLDNNKLNNRLDNLDLKTQRENLIKDREHVKELKEQVEVLTKENERLLRYIAEFC